MFKRSFLISMLIIAMTVMLATPAAALTCRRCRSLEGICVETLWEKIKLTWKTQTTSGFTVEAKSVSFTSWCNPAGECQEPPTGEPHFYPVQFGISGFDIIGEDDLVKGRYVLDKKKFYDCELRDIYLCKDATVPMDYETDDGTTVSVEVCPSSSYLDYSKIPPTSPPYWSEGQIGKWYPEDPFCPSPWVFSSPDSQGGFIVGLMWVETQKVTSECDKDGDCVPGLPEPGEKGCFELLPDGTNYEQVEDCECFGTCPE